MGLIYLCDKCGRKVEYGNGSGTIPRVILYPRNRYNFETIEIKRIVCDECMGYLESLLNGDTEEKTE